MKKLWCILLSAVLVMGLAGCSSNAAGAYKAGTYTGTGTGRNGLFRWRSRLLTRPSPKWK